MVKSFYLLRHAIPKEANVTSARRRGQPTPHLIQMSDHPSVCTELVAQYQSPDEVNTPHHTNHLYRTAV